MARRRRFSEEGFGETVQALMDELGVTYRQLATRTGLSAGYLTHLVHGTRPVPSNDVVATLAKALEVEPEHFREYRLRMITERLEAMPALIDQLYRQLSRQGNAYRRKRCDPCFRTERSRPATRVCGTSSTPSTSPRRAVPARPASTGETVRKSSSTSPAATSEPNIEGPASVKTIEQARLRRTSIAAARSTESASLTATTSVAPGRAARRREAGPSMF